MGYTQLIPHTHINNLGMVKISSRREHMYIGLSIMRNYFVGINRVILLLDEVEKRLAIKPAKEKDKGAYTLGFTCKELSTGVISTPAMVRLPLFKKSIGKRLKAVWNEKEKFLEVNLIK